MSYEVLDEIYNTKATDSDMMRENANVDGDGPMGMMLRVGSEVTKEYIRDNILPPRVASVVKHGYLHVHDMDFYMSTETCCQIDLGSLLERGFSTGHGFIRQPQSIKTAASLACIVIQANQNQMHGGQSIPAFDWAMAPYVQKTYDNWLARLEEINPGAEHCELAMKYTRDDTLQAMEALVHNLNSMNSRAGAQVPFSSLNYGTDTSWQGRMVVDCLLDATLAGLGHGETPIFPVQIFKVKDGVNYKPGDPNYDLLLKACYVSGKRLFPNFEFLDAPYNLQYYREGDPNTEVATMGCRTRVMGNVCGEETTFGRGNLSFTTINLPRLAIEATRYTPAWVTPIEGFYEMLDYYMELAKEQLLHRFSIQCSRHVYNYPFLMGQGVWRGSEGLKSGDSVADVLKQGTLSIGFIGLAETLHCLTGHTQDDGSNELGIEIVRHMREVCDRYTEETGLNFSLLATPAEGLSGRFVRLDKEKYGVIEGVTDKDYYTNSFHVPVYKRISAFEKIAIEAPYHELCNAGHITYIETGFDISKNVPAFMSFIRAAHDAGIGYFAVNHPVDTDPVCGFRGVIGDYCPKCGRREFEANSDGVGESVGFDRLRRITGYLVGTLDRWNDAKRAEEHDRVQHAADNTGISHSELHTE